MLDKSKNFVKKHKVVSFVIAILVFLVVYQYMQEPVFLGQDNALSYAPSVSSARSKAGYEEAAYDMDLTGISEQDRKIKKNARLSLETKKENYDNSIIEIKQVYENNGGYYTNIDESKYRYNEIDYRTYRITFKVPFDNFENTVNELKDVAEVKSVNVDSTDLTTQYMDVKGYLDSYTKEKDKVEKLLEKAEEIEDIIKIQERLTELQRLIDSYTQQLKNIERVTDYSEISVTLEEKRPISEEFIRWTGARELLRNFLGAFDNFIVLISKTLGWLIILGLLWIGYKGFNKISKKK